MFGGDVTEPGLGKGCWDLAMLEDRRVHNL